MAAAIFERLVDDLNKESFLADYKYLKSKSRFVLQKGDVKYIIDLSRRWANGLGDLILIPSFNVRYESINKWFNSFSHRNPNDSNDVCNVMYELSMLTGVYEIKMDLDGNGYQKLYPIIRDTIKACASYVFSRYDSLKHYFEYDILPKIEGRMNLRSDCGDWVFSYLAACKLVAPQLYPKLKKMIMDKIGEMYLYVNGRKIRDGYAALYDGRWDEIFDYLENTDIANLPKRGKKK